MQWSIHKAAVEFGVSREKILRGLNTNGVKTGSRKTYTTREIFHALADDQKAERILLDRARRKKLELENAETEGRLHNVRDVEKTVWIDWLMPLKAALESLPDRLANLLNPDNPTSAHRILGDAIEQIKKQIRDSNDGGETETTNKQTKRNKS